jgi:hypothetical protein
MADHEIGKRLSVDQHDPFGDAGDEVVGGAGELGGCDHHPLARSMALEAANEIADF